MKSPSVRYFGGDSEQKVATFLLDVDLIVDLRLIDAVNLLHLVTEQSAPKRW